MPVLRLHVGGGLVFGPVMVGAAAGCQFAAALVARIWSGRALGEAGIAEAVADAVLNNRQAATRGGVLGAYQRASRWQEQVRAMELWGQLLAAAIERRGEADVALPCALTG
jgi:hypothetical protein